MGTDKNKYNFFLIYSKYEIVSIFCFNSGYWLNLLIYDC